MDNSLLKNAKIIHIALIIGIVFFGLAIFLLYDFEMPNQVLNENFFVINATMLICIPAGFFIKKSLIEKIRPSDSKEQKNKSILTANITAWALAEAAAMFSLVCLLLFYHYAHLVLALFCISGLIAFRPKADMFD